jgi:hypothetical protein
MEIWQGALAGVARRVASLKAGLDQSKRFCRDRGDWSIDIEGALAELAFAKVSNQFFNAGLNTFKSPDVGNVQIRSTNRRDGHLIVRPNDPVNENYFLVITGIPDCRVAGWISGAEACQQKFWRKDSWWVPQGELKNVW